MIDESRGGARGATPAGAGGAALVARALLLAGRALLIIAPVLVALARWTRGSWAGAPVDAGGLPDHVVPQLTMVVVFVWALVVPLLVLPVGSVWLASVSDGVMTVPTVLGTRRVRMDSVRVRAWWVPGRGSDSWFYLLRDGRGGSVIVGHSTVRRLPAEFLDVMRRPDERKARMSPGARLALLRSSALPPLRRALIYAAGLGLLIVWSATAFLIFGAAFAIVAP